MTYLLKALVQHSDFLLAEVRDRHKSLQPARLVSHLQADAHIFWRFGDLGICRER